MIVSGRGDHHGLQIVRTRRGRVAAHCSEAEVSCDSTIAWNQAADQGGGVCVAAGNLI
jgi:hypothetical protein